jgi:hypothetical protein
VVTATATDPLADLARADARVRQATEARRSAILAAYRAGIKLGDIAAALGVTHEVPRRIVRAAGL